MKRTLRFMIMIFMSILAVTPAFGYTFSGTGTSGVPYQIATVAHLIELSGKTIGVNTFFKQMNDIDFPLPMPTLGVGFVPITNFKGTYDGQNNKISNLYINRTSWNSGLFGITDGAIIKNVNMVNVAIKGDAYEGGLIGKAINTQVINCSVAGTLTGAQYSGGLVGCSEGSQFSNSHSTVTVTGAGINVGGLVGCASLSSIFTNCYATGNVDGTNNSTGGLLGNISASTMTNCYATGNVTGTATNTGGLVGSVINNSTVESCYATGDVYGGNTSRGGLVGNISASTIKSSYAKGNITGNGNNTGGFVGTSATSTITNSYATGSVIGDSNYRGGLVGNSTTTTITNCYATGPVNVMFGSGGLIGLSNNTGLVTNSFWDKETSGHATKSAGGIAKTTSQMQDITTFTGATWDFFGETPNGLLEIWKIDPLLNNGYPYLTWAEAYDSTLPVTLTAFLAVQTSENFAKITWITESESSLTGYNIYRNEIKNQDTATRINSTLIGANNSSLGSTYSYVDEKVEVNTTYYYWLQVNEFDGSSNFHGPYRIRIEENHNHGVVVPLKTTLRNIYPNPFNPSTSVSFYMERPENIKINVYNVRGQLITNLLNNSFAKGFHNVVWNGLDSSGQACASGMYFFRMETAHSTQMIKGILMK
ncbi:MAG: GLUG motif-containing protein [Candidatus Cloacimonadales bacterium]